jgi:DNA-binding transcriptional MocR family regulator
MQAEVLELPTDPLLGLDPEVLDAACRERRVRAAVLMPNFSNPTGSWMPDARKRRLAEVLIRRRVALIEDDIYAELAFDRRRSASLFARRSAGAEVPFVLAGSLPRSLLPAGRVGYLVADTPLIDRLVEAKRVSTLANVTLSERLAAECLESGLFDRHLRRLAPRLQEGVRLLAHSVAQHFPEGTRASDPEGGFMLWIELPKEATVSGCSGRHSMPASRSSLAASSR